MSENSLSSIRDNHQIIFDTAQANPGFAEITITTLYGNPVENLLVPDFIAVRVFSRLLDYEDGSLVLGKPVVPKQDGNERRFVDLKLKNPINPYRDAAIRNLYVIESNAVFFMMDPTNSSAQQYNPAHKSVEGFKGVSKCQENRVEEFATKMQALSRFCLEAVNSPQ